MAAHRCDIRAGDGPEHDRPGWRANCLYCRAWYFTDDRSPTGLVAVLLAATQHEGDGSWPTA